MKNPKNQFYMNESSSKSIIKPIFKQSSSARFQLEKISQIDDLLSKNDQIYKNLRKQLQQISQAEKNITNNINAIRPIYYMSKQRQNSLFVYEKFLFESGERQKSLQFENYASSPVQTQRPPYEMNKQKSPGQSNVITLQKIQNNMISQFPTEKDFEQKQQNSNIRRSYTNEFNNVSEPVLRKTNSSIMSNPQIVINLKQSTDNNVYSSNLRGSKSSINQKEQQQFYFNEKKSYQMNVDSIVRMNFGQLSQRKQEIQKIYGQLKKQEEQIQKAYQQYKKGFNQMNKTSTSKTDFNVKKSPPKKASPVKFFAKGKKQQFQSSASRILNNSKKSESNFVTKQQNLKLSHQRSQINDSLDYTNKSSFSPIKSSMIKYYTQQFDTIEIPDKPQALSANSHIFVPFNKLFKSPIIQMKNKNILILARQSKLAVQKTAQSKILDGKKYKFPQNIETEEQTIVKNVLKQNHSIIAIVGGQATLKKKLHMAIIAHSFQKIFKIISNKQYNCLTLSLSYDQMIEKSQNISTKVNNSIDINEETSMRLILMEAQKTIEAIYDAIKRPLNTSESSGFTKIPAQTNKEKLKLVRFTKLSLTSGKQSVWTCQIFSTNQYSYDFLKGLEVKDIIWSINPLIKNYDEVSKTLNEANKYIETRVQP